MQMQEIIYMMQALMNAEIGMFWKVLIIINVAVVMAVKIVNGYYDIRIKNEKLKELIIENKNKEIK